MRTIERTSAFKRDYRRIKATPRHSKDIDSILTTVLEKLVADQALPARNRDHELSGNWNGYRECHLKPDRLLIYRTPAADTLRLAPLGSHSDLFEQFPLQVGTVRTDSSVLARNTLRNCLRLILPTRTS